MKSRRVGRREVGGYTVENRRVGRREVGGYTVESRRVGRREVGGYTLLFKFNPLFKHSIIELCG